MHYYQRHLGDYAKDTGHLTLLEHGVYNVLLDWSYATERPMPPEPDAIYRICRATSAAEKRAVDRILAEFFQGGTNKRVVNELEQFKAVSEQKRQAAVKKHHPEWTDVQVREWCTSNAGALHKQCIKGNTRARVHKPLSINHVEGGAVQVGDAEVLEFGRTWPGEQASGTPGMDPQWVAGMLVKLNGRREWPSDWRRWLVSCWRVDWRSGGNLAPKGISKPDENKKNGARPDGRTPAQQRFELSRELEEVQERLEAAHEVNVEPDRRDVNRERDLKAELKTLGGAA